MKQKHNYNNNNSNNNKQQYKQISIQDDFSTTTTTTTSKRKKKTAKELWNLLRYHVKHESFHIDDFRSKSERNGRGNRGNRGGGGGNGRYSSSSIHFDEMDLPWDFSMMDCFLAFVVYVVVGVVAFSFVFGDFTVLDSVYFAVVTFTTIGYGDLVVPTMGGKLFCALYAVIGIVLLGIALGVVGSKFVEAELMAVQRAEQELSKELLQFFQPTTTTTNDNDDEEAAAAASSLAFLQQKQSSSTNTETLTTTTNNNNNMMKKQKSCYATNLRGSTFLDAEERQQDERVDAEEINAFVSTMGHLLLKYVPALLPLFCAAFFIGHKEGWEWYDVVYYCVVTTTTVGYGDLTPDSESTRLFAIFYIPLAVGAMGHFLGTVANAVVEGRRQHVQRKVTRHELTLHDLQAMESNSSSGNGEVTELDYVSYMLQLMNKVDKQDIHVLRSQFRELDLTHSGTLCRRDLELMAKRRLRTTRAKLKLGSYKYHLLHSQQHKS